MMLCCSSVDVAVGEKGMLAGSLAGDWFRGTLAVAECLQYASILYTFVWHSNANVYGLHMVHI